ncbi:DUF2834 domain-containing protein [Anabaena sp. FACHB-1237]|uniref:DUF2834 domain-containing protein n=1 Tax=Anabaena sp. FACHB-1237 TaxID=2692769 RepID=UPI00168137FB|nr:DUF2834 domain-containing protein [Anabaena sp. FACHB-1237]MBD2137788.1 DUF2834 domain-containing protein [Anabaena sp. FACHB-1237]
MLRKITFGVLWIGFISYAFVFAPPEDPHTFELIKNLSTGNWQNINPIIIALFNIMGIWPFIYSTIVFIDGRNQKIPAWPFATASFALGAFALLPYLALRSENREFTGQKNLFLTILDSRILAILLTLTSLGTLSLAFSGDWSNFWQQWHNNRFIHVMTLDFIMLSLLFPTLVTDDLAKRDFKNKEMTQKIISQLSLIPFVGALIYLCLRPQITSSK